MVQRGIHGGTFDICQIDYGIHSKLSISASYFESYKKCNIQANRSLTNIKEKLSTVRFDVFDLSINVSVLMSQLKSVMNKIGSCYFLLAPN